MTNSTSDPNHLSTYVEWLHSSNWSETERDDMYLAGYTEPGWYFWDEVHHCRGPFERRDHAEAAVKEYIEQDA